jgi:hypothetical protein
MQQGKGYTAAIKTHAHAKNQIVFSYGLLFADESYGAGFHYIARATKMELELYHIASMSQRTRTDSRLQPIIFSELSSTFG